MRTSLLKVVSLIAVACAAVFLFVTIGHSAGSPLLISEFRLRGPNGANDEFVEIYNNSDTAHTVATTDGSTGYALVASDGVARFVIPNGTVIPARGHYLGVNSIAYSLGSYPAGNGTTASGDATYTTNINERVEALDGRVYLVVVTATDTAGNASRACHTVVVPKSKKGNIDAQAAAAKAFCEANNGAAPPGYFVVGDGALIGPKQ